MSAIWPLGKHFNLLVCFIYLFMYLLDNGVSILQMPELKGSGP